MKKLTEEELVNIVYGEFEGVEIIDFITGENNRWTRSVTTIFKYKGKLYALDWEQGLTEYQDNEFYYQPYEVEEYKELIEITKYRAKEKKFNSKI